VTFEVWLQRGAELKMEEFDTEAEADAYIQENEQFNWIQLEPEEVEICKECSDTTCISK